MRNIDLAALGIAHMRRGEVENCVTNRNADVCIFPLTAEARHRLRSGSERAIEYFERYLEKEPSSLEVRWLLNVAYQTLGEYPDKVPKAYLIPPAAFESKRRSEGLWTSLPRSGSTLWARPEVRLPTTSITMDFSMS
jgi:hypothetical protein